MADRTNVPTGYVLGIDLGTTYSAAAIARGTTAESCVLGTIAAQIPSVVVHREDSEILTGEAAERRSGSEPTRTAREFKRRLGDPVPVIVGGTPYGAEALTAEMLEAIVSQVTEREGEAPATIVLTHPANYSEYKRGLLVEAARLAGVDLDRMRLISEPEAAAIAYAHQQRIEPGEIIAVYDLGGGTFDAAVVRDTPEGFELIGRPEGMERLGGIDFDQAVLAHVDSVLDGLISSADTDDPQVVAGQARLRAECRLAKEALSTDTDATIAVAIPGVQIGVRLTRDELEQMVRPRIAETVTALQRTITSAGITPDDVSRVLLVGGSSRLPIVAQIIRETIGRPVSLDADPKLTIAIGAALSSAPRTSSGVGASVDPDHVGLTPAAETRPIVATSPTPDPQAQPVSTASAPGRSRLLLGAGAAAVCGFAVAALAVVALGGDDEPAMNATTSVATRVSSSPVARATPPALGTPDPNPPQSIAIDDSSGLTVERFAFNGGAGGVGIPGPAAEAAAPAELVGIAAGVEDDVYAFTADPSIVGVSGGEAEIAVRLDAVDLPAGGMTVGSDGTLFVATSAGIVRFDDGVRSLVVDGARAGLSSDIGPLALDGGGNLYVADNGGARVLRVAPDGVLTLAAGTGTVASDGSTLEQGAVAVTSDIGRVSGLAVDRGGNLIIADSTRHVVLAVARDGSVTTLATGVEFASINAIAIDRLGGVYVADGVSGTINRIGTDNAIDVILTGVSGSPTDEITALAITSSGTLIYADSRVLWRIEGVARPS